MNIKTSAHRLPASILVLMLAATLPLSAFAGPRDQAKRLHDRIAGIPPSATVLDQMETLVSNGNALGAAEVAMKTAPSTT